MSLLDVIPKNTKAKYLVVEFNGEVMDKIDPSELLLPQPKYTIVFFAIERMLNELEPDMKSLFMDDLGFKSILIAMSAMMPLEALTKFVNEDTIMKWFTVKEDFGIITST